MAGATPRLRLVGQWPKGQARHTTDWACRLPPGCLRALLPLPRQGPLANAKIISLIDAELRKESAKTFSDLTLAIATIDDEFEKLRSIIKQLEARVDLLEHQ